MGEHVAAEADDSGDDTLVRIVAEVLYPCSFSAATGEWLDVCDAHGEKRHRRERDLCRRAVDCLHVARAVRERMEVTDA